MGVLLKILLTGAVIALVWFVVRTRGRINPLKAAAAAVRRTAKDQTTAPSGRKSGGPVAPVEDLVKCPKCGAYGPKGRPCACEVS